MSARPKTLFARLVLSQVIAATATYALTAAFAPRVLLLLPSAESAALAMLLRLGALSLVASLLSTVAFVRPLTGTLRSLVSADGVIPPDDVLRLQALPIRLVVVNVGFAIATSLVCFSPLLRPPALDAYASLALGLLLVTMRATAGLPEYVTMRASVTRTLELASVRSTREALRRLHGAVAGRVRRRFVAAVTAPVAFVALGASLLVDAHVRAYDRSARAADAVDLARAVFEPSSKGDAEKEGSHLRATDEADLVAAQRAARSAGFDVQFERVHPENTTVDHGNDGEGRATIPTASGAVVVRLGASRPSPVVLAYALLAFAAVAIAAILGTRAGGAFEADVVLATHEVRRAGVADVMRGTIIQNEARFAKIDALLHAIDALGGVFREFAGAQERAIDARAATERMRGLLLASMSHDLKAPLNAVLGFAELVGRNPLSDGQRESLAIIEQRGRELLMLIDTILDSARVEVGELEFSPSPTAMEDVVMASVLEARALAFGTSVPIKVEIQPGIPQLFVDGMRIVQALTAVVMTAARFSERGAVEVRATLSDTGHRLRIEIEGSGESLPAIERDKIFDAFKSAESARRHGALGLGLQLARSILEIHGGGVDFDDGAAPGMLFRLWLPVENDSVSIRERASRTALPDSD